MGRRRAPRGPECFERLLSLLTGLDAGSLFFAEFRGTRLAALTVWFGGRATLDLAPTLDYVYDAAAHERYVAAQRDPADR